MIGIEHSRRSDGSGKAGNPLGLEPSETIAELGPDEEAGKIAGQALPGNPAEKAEGPDERSLADTRLTPDMSCRVGRDPA